MRAADSSTSLLGRLHALPHRPAFSTFGLIYKIGPHRLEQCDIELLPFVDEGALDDLKNFYTRRQRHREQAPYPTRAMSNIAASRVYVPPQSLPHVSSLPNVAQALASWVDQGIDDVFLHGFSQHR